MEEIQVGEYVRTKNGIIDKIYEYKEDTKIYICERKLMIDSENMLGTYIQDITNHSFKPIDLIKLGDYVNGEEIIEIRTCGEKRTLIFNSFYRNSRKKREIEEDDIRSIVTKEQFESITYKL